MNDYQSHSQREYEAYRSHELARAGINVGTILKNLGKYDQGVVDAAASANKSKNKETPKPKKKSKKKC